MASNLLFILSSWQWMQVANKFKIPEFLSSSFNSLLIKLMILEYSF